MRAIAPAVEALAPAVTRAVDRPVASRWAPARALTLALLVTGCTTPLPRWSYTGASGPERWATLSASYRACGHEHGQSPIELVGPAESPPPAPRFDYRPSAVELTYDGRGLHLLLRDAGTLQLDDARWRLERIDLHRPSEHALPGGHTPLELQLVHRDAHGRRLIVALLVVGGDANPALARLWPQLPAQAGQRRHGGTLDAATLLPDERAYDAYDGSLTTPPCSEGVRWLVLRNPISMSAADLDALAAGWPEDARPLQPR